jgi:Fur family transcriptional regulator, zinc uptake regulator
MTTAAFPSPGHDHNACLTQALCRAEGLCQVRGQRLTEQRRRVLELIWSSHRPVGAYALLEQLGAAGRKPAPPTIYRSLEFLLELGLIHRIASLNAYVGCSQPGAPHFPRFFLCERCGQAAELEDPEIDQAVAKDAHEMGFQIKRETVEVSGICGRCLLSSD